MVDSENEPKDAEELVDTWISRYRRGSLRFFILHLLQHHHKNSTEKNFKRPVHGYKIAKEIKDVTKGKWHPTTASVYPILKELAEVGVITKVSASDDITQDSHRPVKQYKLTSFGEKVAEKLEAAREEFGKAFIDRNLDELDIETLRKLKSRHEKMHTQNQKVLDRIEERIKKLE
ncbi:MAG: PadR family transcriptional regulator [Candidatus Hodarchaeales archaeon]|jgi:DNA-binding PadR family transcriptional regulator